MKIAFVFPGQGSQYVGMGKDLYDNFDEAKKIFSVASEELEYDVAELCFNGPQDELDQTFRTQPCILTVSYSAFSVLISKGITPAYVAGHSLGEYSAIVASGAILFKDAVKLTEQRGRIMQEAVPEGKGLMAAVIGLNRDEITRVCDSVKSGYVSPANYNCPGQIVIGGEKDAVTEAIRIAEDSGARRALPLAVSAPSHCRLMEKTSDQLLRLLENIDIKTADIPLINNADAKILEKPEDIKTSLIKHLSSPLLWEDSVRVMVENGVDAFVEVGPKKVLSGLIKRITGNAGIMNVEDMESLEKTIKTLQQE